MVQVERAQLQIIQEGLDHRFRLPLLGRVIVIGAGKGAGLLAQELASVLGGRLAGGVVVIPRGQTAELHGVAVVHGEHPLPGPAVSLARSTLPHCSRSNTLLT